MALSIYLSFHVRNTFKFSVIHPTSFPSFSAFIAFCKFLSFVDNSIDFLFFFFAFSFAIPLILILSIITFYIISTLTGRLGSSFLVPYDACMQTVVLSISAIPDIPRKMPLFLPILLLHTTLHTKFVTDDYISISNIIILFLLVHTHTL